MKKRALALLLALCMIVPTLACAPLAAAEEPAALEDVAEAPDALPEEVSEANDAASLEEELPSGDADPAAGESLPEEEIPVEEAPAEGEPAPEEPVSEATGEDIPEGEIPEDGGEFGDGFDTVALGSDNVQYADVAYLSQAAFDSMDSNAQDVYVEMVDQVTDLLDDAYALEDVVFALDADGNLYFNISMPLQGASETLAPEAIEAPIAEEPAPEEELVPEEESAPEEEPVPEEAPVPEGEAALEEEATAAREPIVENMDLIEALEVPMETIEGLAPLEDSMATLDDTNLMQSRTLFWNTKDYYYDQLDSEAKKFFKAGYKGIVQKNKNKFTTSTNMRTFKITAPYDAMSALLLTYPQKFDWLPRDIGHTYCRWVYNIYSGKASVTFSHTKSKYYNASQEKQAQKKVKELVNEAYEFASVRYPSNPTYGIVYYFDDWLCANNYYDKPRGVVSGDPNKDSTVKAKMETEAYFDCHTSYGCLLKGFGVCESYALAMSRLLDAAGIPNLYVIGDTPGARHAWNYVQMPNGVYYLQDTTWDDPINSTTGLTTRQYLLRSDDGRSVRVPTGQLFGPYRYDKDGNITDKYQLFRFPSLSSSNYKPAAESIYLNKSSLYLRKGKTATLSMSSSNSYYDKYQKSWKSSNTKVATVNSSGKVTAKGFGRTNVSLSIAGKTVSCPVYVYEFTGLGFKDNKDKSSYKLTYSGSLNSSLSLNISVKQKSYDASAQSIRSAMNLDAPKVSIDKKGKSVVDNVSAALSGNTIVLSCIPRKVGNATVTVKFAGKSAKLTLQVRQALQSGWFYLADKTSETYSGNSIKPTVKTYSSAPEGLKKNRDYSVSYENVTNAWGTHKVIIKGKGNYSGTIEKTFTIRQASIDSSKLKIGDAKALTYNGAALTAKPTLKLGKKTLKAGVDYEIRYSGSTSAPSAVGSYTLTFVGKNYSGNFSDGKTHKFEIKPVALSKLKISMSSSVKANGSRVSASSLKLKLMSGKKEISSSNYNVSFQDSKHNAISLAPYESGTYYAVVTPRGSNIDASKTKSLTKKFIIKK